MEPWFRRRWYGWQPIHPIGWAISIGWPVFGLLCFLLFLRVPEWGAFIFCAALAVCLGLNVVTISRTEKR
jgi:hypothetical protein